MPILTDFASYSSTSLTNYNKLLLNISHFVFRDLSINSLVQDDANVSIQ